MLVKCPVCQAEYELEPGKYKCECGAKFFVEEPQAEIEASELPEDDPNKTMPPRRPHDEVVGDDQTMPGKRDRKPDGRFEPGDLIMDRYKVLAELGQGGMGVVYKCFDETAGIEIALKALPPELSHNTLEMEDIKENFQLVHNLHHPNIASSNNLEKDNTNGNYYLIMECVEGEDLRRWIKRKRRDGSLDLESVLPVIRQVADALDYAHEQKIIHRDIKPGNIMIDTDGHVKVLDFGLAAQIHTSMTRVSMAYHGTSGTGPYMAPEQWRGRVQGAAADQYALAVMTYEMLAGHLPFESTDAAILQQAVLTQTAEPLESVPKHVQTAVGKAMGKEPADRFSSCADFVAALAGKKFAMPKIGGTQKKRFLFIAMAVIAALAVAIIATVAIVNSMPSSGGGSNQSRGEMTDAGDVWPQEESRRREEDRPSHLPAGDYTLVLSGGVKLGMVKVEAGSFEMSAKDGVNCRNEKPHRAMLTKDFYLGQTEVTQAQWKAVMGADYNSSHGKGDDLPVESVSWNDAMEFCTRLQQSGKAPKGWKFTLPTETQWEYAARGGRKSRGYKYSGSNNLDEVAWYDRNSGSKTHPVGTKKANELGLYDMSGNAEEWCLDDYQNDSTRAKPEFERGNDQYGSNRVIRGGSWYDIARFCRSAYRDNGDPGFSIYYVGFRLALVPVQ